MVDAWWPLPEAKFVFKCQQKKSKFKLEELFSASSFGVCLYIKSDLHKILDNFYLNGFHIEEMTSYGNLAGHNSGPSLGFETCGRATIDLNNNFSCSKMAFSKVLATS